MKTEYFVEVQWIETPGWYLYDRDPCPTLERAEEYKASADEFAREHGIKRESRIIEVIK